MALGQQHAELGRYRDDQRPQRDRHRVQGHAHSEQDQRRPAAGEHDRRERHEGSAPISPEGEQQHERDRREPGQQRDQAPPGRGDLSPRLGRQHGKPDQARADAGRGMQARAHRIDQLLLLVEAHQADAERQRRGAQVGRDHVLREIGRDRSEQACDLCRGEAPAAGRASAGRAREEIRQREGWTQPRLAAAARRAVAEALEHGALVDAHPFDRRGRRDVLATDHQVDFPPDSAGLLECTQVLQRAQALRHELGDVGLHARLGVEAPAERRQREPQAQHPLGAPHRDAERNG